MKEYAVIFEWGPKNWSAYVPDLPGCISTGKDRRETECNIRQAIEEHIRFLRQEGDPIPEPTCVAGMVQVAM